LSQSQTSVCVISDAPLFCSDKFAKNVGAHRATGFGFSILETVLSAGSYAFSSINTRLVTMSTVYEEDQNKGTNAPEGYFLGKQQIPKIL
jgi:hypothetical protein